MAIMRDDLSTGSYIQPDGVFGYPSSTPPVAPVAVVPFGQPGQYGSYPAVGATAGPMAYSLPPEVIQAVIQAESGGDPRAISPAGAMGLMQLMPQTALQYGAVDPFNPEQNQRAGTRYLSFLMDKYHGDLKTALAAYNWGPGNVDQWLARGGRNEQLPAETQGFLNKVINAAAANNSRVAPFNAVAGGTPTTTATPMPGAPALGNVVERATYSPPTAVPATTQVAPTANGGVTASLPLTTGASDAGRINLDMVKEALGTQKPSMESAAVSRFREGPKAFLQNSYAPGGNSWMWFTGGSPFPVQKGPQIIDALGELAQNVSASLEYQKQKKEYAAKGKGAGGTEAPAEGTGGTGKSPELPNAFPGSTTPEPTPTPPSPQGPTDGESWLDALRKKIPDVAPVGMAPTPVPNLGNYFSTGPQLGPVAVASDPFAPYNGRRLGLGF